MLRREKRLSDEWSSRQQLASTTREKSCGKGSFPLCGERVKRLDYTNVPTSISKFRQFYHIGGVETRKFAFRGRRYAKCEEPERLRETETEMYQTACSGRKVAGVRKIDTTEAKRMVRRLSSAIAPRAAMNRRSAPSRTKSKLAAGREVSPRLR